MKRTVLELTLDAVSVAGEEVRRCPKIHLQYNYKERIKISRGHYSYPVNPSSAFLQIIKIILRGIPFEKLCALGLIEEDEDKLLHMKDFIEKTRISRLSSSLHNADNMISSSTSLGTANANTSMMSSPWAMSTMKMPPTFPAQQRWTGLLGVSPAVLPGVPAMSRHR